MSDTRKVRYPEFVAVALVLRVTVALLVLHTHGAQWFFAQASELGQLAASVSAGQGLSSPFGGATGPSAFLAPGYPLFVAAIFHLFGNYSAASAFVLLLMQSIFGAATVWMLMLLAQRLFGVAVANLAGLVWAISLPLLWMSSIFWETSFSILLCTALFVSATYVAEHAGPSAWIRFGALSGIALMTNPSLMSVMACCVVWLIYRSRATRSLAPLAGLIICACFCIPWVIRNEVDLHAFLPLRSNAGYELWQGNRPGGDGFFDPRLHLNVNRQEFSSYERMGELAYMRGKGELAKEQIHSHPGIFAALTLKRIGCFWTGLGRGPSAFVTCYICLTSVMGFAGLVLFRKRSALTTLLVPTLLLFPAPYYITHPDFRFRLVIDPIMVMLSAYLVMQLWTRRSAERLT